jgi:hypothetical protein
MITSVPRRLVDDLGRLCRRSLLKISLFCRALALGTIECQEGFAGHKARPMRCQGAGTEMANGTARYSRRAIRC